MKVLSVLGRCSQLPLFYKFTIVGVFALVLIGKFSLHAAPLWTSRGIVSVPNARG